MTQRQLNEWLAWNLISPIGERRADTRFAVMTAHLRDVLIEGDDVEPRTFLPQFEIYSLEDSDAGGLIDESEEEAAMRQRREASQFL